MLNNDTFYNYYLRILRENNDELDYRFKDRDLRIRYLAYILSLVSKLVYGYFNARSRENTEIIINRVVNSGGNFKNLYETLSIYIKIRAFTL